MAALLARKKAGLAAGGDSSLYLVYDRCEDPCLMFGIYILLSMFLVPVVMVRDCNVNGIVDPAICWFVAVGDCFCDGVGP